jgi:hypothetical protein
MNCCSQSVASLIARKTALVAVALLSGCATVQAPSPPEAPTAPVVQPAGPRSPFAEPPGVINIDVTQANVANTICVSGWTATVRPPTSYTQALKRTMLTRAGLDPNTALVYELDHFIPLAVGGHPRSEDNLWLQKWDGEWNAKVKDRLERKLQVMVCAGQITLNAARLAIQQDWRAAYRKYVADDPTAVPRGVEEEEPVE